MGKRITGYGRRCVHAFHNGIEELSWSMCGCSGDQLIAALCFETLLFSGACSADGGSFDCFVALKHAGSEVHAKELERIFLCDKLYVCTPMESMAISTAMSLAQICLFLTISNLACIFCLLPASQRTAADISDTHLLHNHPMKHHLCSRWLQPWMRMCIISSVLPISLFSAMKLAQQAQKSRHNEII
jgi:hypothetical protein